MSENLGYNVNTTINLLKGVRTFLTAHNYRLLNEYSVLGPSSLVGI